VRIRAIKIAVYLQNVAYAVLIENLIY